jgi:hypothetical protein
MKTLLFKLASVTVICLSLVACQSSNIIKVSANSNQSLNGICTPLSFSGDTWPASLPTFQRLSLELGLNISGSFEGASGWANLTNNFDGQGLSMGLLNQNLGQDSLQPLLVQMRNQNMATLQQIFSSADLTSLLGMLSQWESTKAASAKVQKTRLSVKDIPATSGVLPEDAAATASVAWAAATLYSGTNFLPNWQTELTNLGQNPQFVSIQIAAALALHTQAVQDIAPIGVNELRTYLMAFDIEVQDGGIYAQDFTDYATWLQTNGSSSDTAKLVEMLNLRLRHVQAAYVSDVQSRKLAIINGSGVVHGDLRNLESQYCFSRMIPYQLN